MYFPALYLSNRLCSNLWSCSFVNSLWTTAGFLGWIWWLELVLSVAFTDSVSVAGRLGFKSFIWPGTRLLGGYFLHAASSLIGAIDVPSKVGSLSPPSLMVSGSSLSSNRAIGTDVVLTLLPSRDVRCGLSCILLSLFKGNFGRLRVLVVCRFCDLTPESFRISTLDFSFVNLSFSYSLIESLLRMPGKSFCFERY